MTPHPDNPPAFPHQPLNQSGLPSHEASPGMTLRDWFAGQALPGIMQASSTDEWTGPEFAKCAYEIADAMLAARKEGA